MCQNCLVVDEQAFQISKTAIFWTCKLCGYVKVKPDFSFKSQLPLGSHIIVSTNVDFCIVYFEQVCSVLVFLLICDSELLRSVSIFLFDVLPYFALRHILSPVPPMCQLFNRYSYAQFAEVKFNSANLSIEHDFFFQK